MKKAFTVLVAALLSFSLIGLFGCGGETPAKESVVQIDVYHQSQGNVSYTNYQVQFSQTGEEWNSLSDDEKEKLVLEGYDQAVALIKEQGVSNFNISGVTTPVAESDGQTPSPSQLTFMLDHEKSTVIIYGNTSAEGVPELLREVEVPYPLS